MPAPLETGGTLYGVGVGPGDPELVTRKAWAHIQQATHLVYPVPAHLESSRARTIVAQAISPTCREIPYKLPMRKARAPAQDSYDDICHRIRLLLASGHNVSVLCEGDPSFYGSYLYIRARLTEFCSCIIPGISSVMAGAALTGFVLGVREEKFGALPATLSHDDLVQGLQHLNSVVFIKAGQHIPKLKQVLRGWQGYYAQNVSYDDEYCCDLDNAPEIAPYFSIVFARKNHDPWT